MRVKSKKTQVRTYAEMTVTSDINGAIVFHGRMDNGECWHKALQPKDAVQVWRRMMGEVEDAMHIPSPHLDIRYDEHEGTWTFSDKEVLCVLDADECMLVAWAIEKAAGIALYNGSVHPVRDKDRSTGAPCDSKISKVWVLSWRRMLTGDASGEGTELIGGGDRVYSTRESAILDLPDILRGLVRDCHPEGHFVDGEGEDHKSNTINGTVDEILKDQKNLRDKWLYDGSTQSFEVELQWIPVRP